MTLRRGKTRKHSEGYITNLFWDRFPDQDILYCSAYGSTENESHIRALDIIKAMKDQLPWIEEAKEKDNVK